jgi:ABC-type branched-subunit amino acid transport system substrate-binding protein
MRQCSKHLTHAFPMLIASTLVLAACGGGSGSTPVAQQPAAPAPAVAGAPAPAVDPKFDAAAPLPARVRAAAPAARTVAITKTVGAPKAVAAPKATRALGTGPSSDGASGKSASGTAENQRIYDEKAGSTDIGVTKDAIKLGSINMHGMALGNIITGPQVRANLATVTAINDRGGVLGRRISVVDCDDGPGEVSRAKACLRKLVGQDGVFSLITGIDWATASIHDDLKQDHLPYVGAWAYSHTEWQDPFMFPTHMSMVHEAMAGANWAKDVIHPKTYGLICLTSPEMQLACDAVSKILDASGAKLVKRADVSISETSMSAYVLAMRAANPDHIIHYVINPATIAKFMVEAAQQGYWPSRGMSGNHLTTEALGSLIGTFPAGRYWTNTTFRLWGSEYMATMLKYARANRGLNHHITQAGYAAINMFAQAAKQVGPNLTRDRLMAQLGNGSVWQADASLGQKFSYSPAERDGDNWSPDNVQGHEFMYQYTSSNTVSNPDGSPSGFKPAEGQFVIHSK